MSNDLIEGYGCYTIQSALGAPGKDAYIHIPRASLATNEVITLWGYHSRGVDFTDHFEFVLIPVPDTDGTFYLVNHRSGLALQIPKDVVPAPVTQGTPGEGDPKNPADDELFERAAQFVLEPATDPTTGEALYRLANQMTGKYLAAKDGVIGNGTPLVGMPAIDTQQAPDVQRRFLFRLTPVAALMGRVPKPQTVSGPRFPQLDDLNTDLPRDTEPVLREIEVVPFFRISDAAYPAYRQVAVSPYYTLGLSTLWRKVFDRQLDGIVKRETTEATETGLTTFDAQSVASTFSWSVSTEVQAGYKGVGFSASAKVTAKLAGETKRTSESSEEQRQAHRFTETIVYPATGSPYRLVKWRPVDRYELRRKDGSLVARWDAVRAEEEVIDVYPRGPGARARKAAAVGVELADAR